MKPGSIAQLSAVERRVVLDALIERLPEWLELVDANAEQPRFVDRRHAEAWRLFAGGAFDFGATDERIAGLFELRRAHPELILFHEMHEPVQRVTVAPFLMMEHPVLDANHAPRVCVMGAVKEARALLATRGARLPSELEWEFAFFAARQQPEGWVHAPPELCADGWSLSLEGWQAPQRPGEPSVVRIGSFDPDDPDSVLPSRRSLAQVRIATVRGVLDLPAITAR